jgi:hypothetical protein
MLQEVSPIASAASIRTSRWAVSLFDQLREMMTDRTRLSEFSFGVKAISRQQKNVGFRSDSGASRGNLGRPLSLPIAPSTSAIGNVR